MRHQRHLRARRLQQHRARHHEGAPIARMPEGHLARIGLRRRHQRGEVFMRAVGFHDHRRRGVIGARDSDEIAHRVIGQLGDMLLQLIDEVLREQ